MQGKVTTFLRKPPRLVLWASLVVMTSCVSLAEYERIKGRVATLEAKQAEDDRTRSDEIAVVKQQCEFSTRQISSRLDCNNNQVRDFLKACEEGSDVCSDQGADNALAFMDSQPYVLMFLRSTLETQDLNSTRVGQIMTLSEAKT